MRRLLSVLLIAASTLTSASVTALPGSDEQVTRIGATFANPIRFLVRDEAGNAVENARVRIITSPQPPVVCCLEPDAFTWWVWAISGADGIATFPALIGEKTGSTTFQVNAYRSDVVTSLGDSTLHLIVSSDPPPARLVDLTAATPLPAGERKADAFRVQVLDTAGGPIARAVLGMRASTENLPPGSYPAAGAFDVDPPLSLSVTSGIVANDEGIATVAFTPALAKPSRNQAAAGATPAGIVTASLRELQLPIAYTVAPAGPDTPSTLQDLWWGGLSENGWGVSVIEHAADGPFDLPRLFTLLFIYDASGNPVWYVMPAGSWTAGYGSTWIAPIFKPHGSPFYNYAASTHGTGDPVGEMRLEFSGARAISMRYRFYGFVPGQLEFGEDVKRLERLDFSGGAPSPRQQASDLWWGGIAQNGWGIAVHENPGALFNLWFTYGADGSPLWFVMSNGSWVDSDTFSGPIFKPFGSRWIGVAYEAKNHREETVGTFAMRLGPGTPPGQATFTYSLDGHNGSETLNRVPF